MGSLLVLLVIAGAVLLALVGVYNGLVQKRIAADNAWSQIEVQLKRRHDLVPNLVATVQGYAGHEKTTLEAVIKARNAAVQASQHAPGAVKDQIAAENILSSSLRQLFALSESYPDLKANINFAQLQEELASTENKISFARQHYNDSVAVFNTAIEQIPGNLVAGFGNFPRKDFYEVDAAEKQVIQQAPKVTFS